VIILLSFVVFCFAVILMFVQQLRYFYGRVIVQYTTTTTTTTYNNNNNNNTNIASPTMPATTASEARGVVTALKPVRAKRGSPSEARCPDGGGGVVSLKFALGLILKRSAQVQYNCNTTAIQEFFSCIAVVLLLCGTA